jgi:dCMP deaminase
MNGTDIYRRPGGDDGEVIDLLAQVRPRPTTNIEAAARHTGLHDRLMREAYAPEAGSRCAVLHEGGGCPGYPQAGRPSWDEFFFRVAELAASMATCPRARCGAVLVRHKRVLSIGFNGADSGAEHCPTEGEALDGHLALDHCDRSVHAEVNSLRNAIGNLYGATAYVYGHYRPCPPCLAELARVGVTDVRHRPGPRIGPDRNWG